MYALRKIVELAREANRNARKFKSANFDLYRWFKGQEAAYMDAAFYIRMGLK
jgi:hypothetical protein